MEFLVDGHIFWVIEGRLKDGGVCLSAIVIVQSPSVRYYHRFQLQRDIPSSNVNYRSTSNRTSKSYLPLDMQWEGRFTGN